VSITDKTTFFSSAIIIIIVSPVSLSALSVASFTIIEVLLTEEKKKAALPLM